METKTKTHRLKGSVEFRRPSGDPFSTTASGVTLVSLGEVIVECRLRFVVTADQCREIRDGQLFNVNDAVLSPHLSDIVGDEAVVVEASLRPDLLTDLSVQGLRTGPSFVTLLRSLPASSGVHDADSWFCLTATALEGETLFKTLWAYLDLGELASEERSEAAFMAALVSFSNEQMFGALDDGGSDAQSESERAVFAALIDATFDMTGDPQPGDADTTDDWTGALDDDVAEALVDMMSSLMGEAGTTEVAPDSMTVEVAELLRRSGWEFHQLHDLPVFSMQVQGHSGEWAAYGQVIEAASQFVFYSVVPVKAPSPAVPSVAEFVTRANHDLAIGNFELDYESGEVRFKTSIDVTGSRLDAEVIDQLIHTNLTTTDRYLGGLIGVMYGTQTSLVAIETIEGGVAPAHDD